MNTEITSNPTIVLLNLKEKKKDKVKQLPHLGNDTIFEKARNRLRKCHKKGLSLPKIQSNYELIASMLNKKANENNSHNHHKRIKSINSLAIMPNKIKEKEKEGIAMKPIQSPNFIKQQLIHIKSKSKSLLSEERERNLSLKSIAIKKRNKPQELSSFKIYFTNQYNDKSNNYHHNPLNHNLNSNNKTHNKVIDLINNFNIKNEQGNNLHETNNKSMTSMEGNLNRLVIKENIKRKLLFKEQEHLQRNRSNY